MSEPDRLQLLLLRRERLVARSGQLRERLHGAAVVVQRPLAWADTVRSGWHTATHWLQQHPQWLAGGLVVLLIARPRGMLRWGSRLYAGYQLAQRSRPIWQPVANRFMRR